jgi:hypothetical protein
MDNPMRLNRTLLYTGVFLVAIGASMLAVDARSPSTNELIALLGLWPVTVIAIGLGIVLWRTPYSLLGGLVAFAVPGLVLGGVLALGPRLADERGVWDEFRTMYEESRHYCSDVEGRFDFGNVHIPMGGCS